MSKDLRCIIPVPHLKEAEEAYEDTSELIAPYLEALRQDDFDSFYDHLAEVLPLAGDNEDVYFDKNSGLIQNFDILCDNLVTAIEPIKYEVENRVPVPNGYHIVSSKKLDDCSVLLTLSEDPSDPKNIMEDQIRSKKDQLEVALQKVLLSEESERCSLTEFVKGAQNVVMKTIGDNLREGIINGLAEQVKDFKLPGLLNEIDVSFGTEGNTGGDTIGHFITLDENLLVNENSTVTQVVVK